MVKGMTTCKVCGRDFPLIREEHYTARDPEKTGVIPTITGSDEAQQYDAFDCPHCGCQNVMQARKGEATRKGLKTRTEEVSGDCSGCRFEDLAEDEYPCNKCKHCYTDYWTKKRGEEDVEDE